LVGRVEAPSDKIPRKGKQRTYRSRCSSRWERALYYAGKRRAVIWIKKAGPEDGKKNIETNPRVKTEVTEAREPSEEGRKTKKKTFREGRSRGLLRVEGV